MKTILNSSIPPHHRPEPSLLFKTWSKTMHFSSSKLVSLHKTWSKTPPKLPINIGSHSYHFWHHHPLQNRWGTRHCSTSCSYVFFTKEVHQMKAPGWEQYTPRFNRWNHPVQNNTLQRLPDENTIGIHKFENALKGKPKMENCKRLKGKVVLMKTNMLDLYYLNASINCTCVWQMHSFS